MIYYFLPTDAIAGGVKVGFQFLEMLISLGVRGVMATPQGRAPQWFPCAVPVVAREKALPKLTARDWAVINWPLDLDELAATGARLVAHLQGIPHTERVLAHPGILLLSCWEEAARHVREHYGRPTVPVGISLSPGFFLPGELKRDNEAAYMPRRGLAIATKAAMRLTMLDWRPLEGLGEPQVIQRLQRAGVYLATAVDEQFGLPALEAMAAGCLVASVPVIGGREYLRDGYNCLVDEPERLIERLGEMMHPRRAGERELMRQRARATAYAYHPYAQRRRLAHLLEGPLREFRD